MIAIITSIYGLTISFIVPIYLFAFLQKKKSNILYFSLPIKKESLFIKTSYFAIFSTIVPVIVNYLIAIMINNLFLPAPINYQLLSVILLIVYMMCIQSFTTVIVLLCQNILDSFLVSLAYMLVPILFYGCYEIYLSSLSNQFMIGTGNYTAVFNPMFNYICIAYNAVTQIDYCIGNNGLLHFVQFFYWFIITIGFNIIAYKLFKKRTLEQSENYTRSIFIYPLLITIIIFSLMLAIYHKECDTNTITFYIIIFIFYLLMYFFAIRKVRLIWKMPVIFIILIIGCIGFANAFESTTGFGMISEYPTISQQQSFTMQIYFNKPIIYNNKSIDYMTIDSKNKNTLQLIYEFHHELINDKIVTPYYETDFDAYAATVDIIYASDSQYTCHHSEELTSY